MREIKGVGEKPVNDILNKLLHIYTDGVMSDVHMCMVCVHKAHVFTTSRQHVARVMSVYNAVA